MIGLIIAETGRAPGQCSILDESEEAGAKFFGPFRTHISVMSAPFCLVLSSLSPPNSEHVPGLSNLQIILKRALFLAKPTSGTLPALKDTPISVDLQAGEGFPDTPICNGSLAFRLGRAFKTIRMDGFLRLRNPLTGARLRSLLFLRLSASPGTCKGESKKLPVDRASGERRFGAGRDIFYVCKKT